jgi:hypothetical protein
MNGVGVVNGQVVVYLVSIVSPELTYLLADHGLDPTNQPHINWPKRENRY